MQLVPIFKITVAENRQRRDFDPAKLVELQTSIEQFGLMHPIVVRPDGDGWHLVAGERRLRAIKDIWALGGRFDFHGATLDEGQVPVVSLGELGPLEAEEAELDENIRRTDLTWQEHAAVMIRLHNLRTQQAAARGETHTVMDTAEEVTGSRGNSGPGAGAANTTRTSILVARHLDDPDVARAKSVDEAFKIVKRKEEQAKNAELAARVGNLTTESHSLLQGDALDVLAGLPNDYFDVILTDPPYGMGADDFGDSGGRVAAGAHQYSDDDAAFARSLHALKIAFHKCKPAAHAYIFCDFDRFAELREWVRGGGWTVFRTPLIWHKPGGRVPLPEHGPRRQYECILYAYRGDRRVLAIKSDVLSYAPDDNLGHGAQKPVELYQDLLSRSARPGDKVLDPFCGTGTIFPAANGVRVFATGIEIDPAIAGIAARRLKEL